MPCDTPESEQEEQQEPCREPPCSPVLLSSGEDEEEEEGCKATGAEAAGGVSIAVGASSAGRRKDEVLLPRSHRLGRGGTAEEELPLLL